MPLGASSACPRQNGLELESSKTKILKFGRFAADKAKAKGKTKPENFDFLGFTFYCSTDRRKSFFRCKVKTSGKKYRNKLKAMNNWIKQNRNLPIQLRMHPVPVPGKKVRVVGTNGSLTGYAGGIDKKIALLELEHTNMSDFFVPKKGTTL